MKFSVKDLCTPASIYFYLSVIGLIVALVTKFQVIAFVVNLFFVILYSWFLNYLCSKGLSMVSWFLVFLPILIFTGVIVMNMDMISVSRK